MVAAGCSEMLVPVYKTTWQDLLEDSGVFIAMRVLSYRSTGVTKLFEKYGFKILFLLKNWLA
jgi:hypothetical protein